MKKVKNIVIIVIACLALIAISIYDAIYVNPYQLKVRTETIRDEKISSNLDGLTIAYFSDIYFDDGLDRTYFDRAINTVKNFNADVVIFGGDLTAHNLSDDDITYVTNGLKTIGSKLGKYYVLGDYDYEYKDVVEKIMSDSGFKKLDNNLKRINKNNDYFSLVGLDSTNLDSSCLANIDSEHFSMVVAHFPDSFDRIKDASFDYMIAGHSLGGPVYLPLINFFNRPVGAQKYFKGSSSSDGKKLDITNGCGLREKKSARFLADAEVVLYKLESTN